MKVIVTGGAGYIGSHTIIRILESTNWEVVSIDSYLNSRPKTFERIRQITGKTVENFEVDLANNNETLDCFKKIGKVDGVIHFAALKAVGESVEKPLFYYKNNIQGLLNVLEASVANKIPNFIFSSSCSIYGNVEKLPVDENTPLAVPESPYAATKAMGETILNDFKVASDLNITSLRYFNPVGAHESGLIGEDPINKPNNLFPVITQTAVGKIEKMSVFGDDYQTRDGSCIRDYIHVCDIADAHILSLKHAIESKNQQSVDFYNLGSGNGVSVLEAINTFEEISDKKLNYHIADRRAGDVEAIFSNSAKAHKELGWEVKNNLNDMMSSAWKWQQQLEKESNE